MTFKITENGCTDGLRGIVATRDIEKGELVLTEKPIALELLIQPNNIKTDIIDYFNDIFDSHLKSNQIVYIDNTTSKCVTCQMTKKIIKEWPKKDRDHLLNDYVSSAILDEDCKQICKNELETKIHKILNTNIFELMLPFTSIDTFGSALYETTRLFNHSCIPNCCNYNDTINIYIRALRDIKKGEELTISYFGLIQDNQLLFHRNLRLRFGFICKCSMCTQNNYYELTNEECKNIIEEKDDIDKDNEFAEIRKKIENFSENLPSFINSGLCYQKSFEIQPQYIEITKDIQKITEKYCKSYDLKMNTFTVEQKEFFKNISIIFFPLLIFLEKCIERCHITRLHELSYLCVVLFSIMEYFESIDMNHEYLKIKLNMTMFVILCCQSKQKNQNGLKVNTLQQYKDNLNSVFIKERVKKYISFQKQISAIVHDAFIVYNIANKE